MLLEVSRPLHRLGQVGGDTALSGLTQGVQAVSLEGEQAKEKVGEEQPVVEGFLMTRRKRQERGVEGQRSG